MPASLDPATPVGRLVMERPSRVRVLERFGVDYCCGGSRTLAEACAAHAGQLAAVLAALEAADGAADPQAEPDYRRWELPRLLDHVVARYHEPLREELPAVAALAERVAQAHGERHPELLRLAAAFAVFREELEQHMLKEEEVFFPTLRDLAAGRRLPRYFGGSLRVPVYVLDGDHRSADRALRFFRQMTDGYTAPADACSSWRALLDRLRALEEDMHRHVHLESELVHPRALELAGD